MYGAILMPFALSPAPLHPSSMGSRTLLLFVLFVLASLTDAVSQTLHSDPIFSQSPTSSPASDATTAAFRRQHFRRVLLGFLLGSFTGFLASLLFIFSLRHCLFYATRAPILAGPITFTPDIDPADLRAALSGAGDPHPIPLIGSGPSGNYYRVELQPGLVLAVKTLDPPSCPDCSPSPPRRKRTTTRRRLHQGLQLLGMVRHRNVMPLRAYLLAADDEHGHHRRRLSLVYDYMPHGSLEDAMKRARLDQETRLGWAARHRIAVGVAKGLRHLHFECSSRIVHAGLKPANVLLDEEMEPRLTDSGLRSLLAANDPTAGAGVGSSYSTYTAPECFQNLRYTDKSDIFSFGVLLAVLLTGRDPSDSFGGETGNFVRWLRQFQHPPAGVDSNAAAKEALDKSMLGDDAEEEEMLMAFRIAIVCVTDAPAGRPSSDELVAMLTQLHSF